MFKEVRIERELLFKWDHENKIIEHCRNRKRTLVKFNDDGTFEIFREYYEPTKPIISDLEKFSA